MLRMDRLSAKLASLLSACVLVCAVASFSAVAGFAQQPATQQPEPPEPTAPTESPSSESAEAATPGPELLFTPAPVPIDPILAPTIFDPPVPYFSQVSPIDDPTAFDPRLELAPD